VFNRPFDSQTKLLIRQETEAKLHIQQRIKENKLKLVWSYILDYENSFNPFIEKREAISLWKNEAFVAIQETEELIKEAIMLMELGIKSKDALHLASALSARADYFITTDISFLKKTEGIKNIGCINPVNFLYILEEYGI